jgi:hypothetical protein
MRSTLIACLALLVTACAADIQRVPSAEPTLVAGTPAPSFQLAADAAFELHTGYVRTLRSGSRWTLVGGIAQGLVYRPDGSVLTVEGANVHEAYLVVSGTELVGFYLPVEKAFVALTPRRVLPIRH